MQDPAGEVRTNLYVMYSYGPLHMDEHSLDDLLEPTYSSSSPIRDLTLKTNRNQRKKDEGSEKGSEIYVLMAYDDDDDDDDSLNELRIYIYIYILELWNKIFVWGRYFDKLFNNFVTC